MESPFRCPLCQHSLLRDGGSLRCERGHGFDVARQGYVNLLLKKPDTGYEDKALFAARRKVYQAGFFDPILAALKARIPGGRVLDAGCGEGSLLRGVCGGEHVGMGMDIAKEAVKMAAAAYKGLHWCVGDVCHIPLPDGGTDHLINMLTPANYGEFHRVLGGKGFLYKVVPGAGHLREIRAMAGKSPYERTLRETLAVLGRHFQVIEEVGITYQVPCDGEQMAHVYAMTPLTTHGTMGEPRAGAVTVEVTLLVATGSNGGGRHHDGF